MKTTYWLPKTVQFQNHWINILDIDTGLEFILEDIRQLVCPDYRIEALVAKLPLNLRRKRHLFPRNGEPCQENVDTLCWLALKYVFNLFGYEQHREFIRWIRKEVIPKLLTPTYTGESSQVFLGQEPPNHQMEISSQTKNTLSYPVKVGSQLNNELIATKLKSVHWFNTINNHQLLLLSKYKKEFSLIGAPPTLIPVFLTTELSQCYLDLLYKQVKIPAFSETDNLLNHLLRRRYLDFCQLCLENEKISYSDLYQTFITNEPNLFAAQELDIALIFYYLKNSLSFPIVKVLSGGVFLQAIDMCSQQGFLDEKLTSSLSIAYFNWLSTLLMEIIAVA